MMRTINIPVEVEVPDGWEVSFHEGRRILVLERTQPVDPAAQPAPEPVREVAVSVDDANLQWPAPAASNDSKNGDAQLTDTQRIDWLDQHGCDQFSLDITRGIRRWFDALTDGSDYSPTLRMAIDAAIRNQK